jgi:hypothetical protein
MGWNGRGGRVGKRTMVSAPFVAQFELSISSSQRYLQDQTGTPFFIFGDAAWALVVQLTRTQIDSYIAHRVSQGFNAILFMLIDRGFSSQTPKERTVEGYDPFTVQYDFTTPNEPYWDKVDYIINKCNSMNLMCLIPPLYIGYGPDEGWWDQINSASNAALTSYGTFVGNRYKQKNIIWMAGGDEAETYSLVQKQWKLFEAMTAANPNALITGHGKRAQPDAAAIWDTTYGIIPTAGFNINSTYTNTFTANESWDAYNRANVRPNFLIEAYYENERGTTNQELRAQVWMSFLSGCNGHFYGKNPVWGFGEPYVNGGGGPANAIQPAVMNTTAVTQMKYAYDLIKAYPWYLSAPKRDTTLVTSSLGPDDLTKVCARFANDGSFGMVWKNNANSITINLASFTVSSVRARWFDPTNNTFSTVSGSPFTNTGTTTIAHPGNNSEGSAERILVLDQEPLSFGVSISSSQRYLQNQLGNPFFIFGDTPWSLVVQLTTTQVDTYLNHRVSQGFNSIQFNIIENGFSSQTPKYRTVEGYDPFTTAYDFTSPNEQYWAKVDYIINKARSLNMLCVINPMYMGIDPAEGFISQVMAASDSALTTYGAFLGARYTQPNIIWTAGGDNADFATYIAKNWKVIEGIRSINPNVLVTGHPGRGAEDAAAYWYQGYGYVNTPGFNVNAAYTNEFTVWESYNGGNRPVTYPVFLLEAFYENENSSTNPILRAQAWMSFLSGCCGHFYGKNPVWGLGEPLYNGGGPANAISPGVLNTTAVTQLKYMYDLVVSYPWHLSSPKLDTTLVTSALGPGDLTRVCPRFANNGSFGLVWKNDTSNITINLASFTIPSIRARWFDPANNTFSAISGSPFTNTGTTTISHPGNNSEGSNDRILVLDGG